jgi:hypothetical protein
MVSTSAGVGIKNCDKPSPASGRFLDLITMVVTQKKELPSDRTLKAWFGNLKKKIETIKYPPMNRHLLTCPDHSQSLEFK